MKKIAILGLGEAGKTYAAALSGHLDVQGWDPAVTELDADVTVTASAADAIHNADAVLSFVPSAHALSALSTAREHARSQTVYADFSTASPQLKRELAESAEAADLLFVDAAIMAPVRRGASRALVYLSGAFAPRLAELLERAGIPVEVVPGPAGSAAGRKLLRSVLVKGLTAVMIEALRAAEHEDLTEWFASHLLDTVTGFDRTGLAGLVDGTGIHAVRRIDEMEAAAAMIESSGGSADMTRAVIEVLRSVADDGVPDLPH